MSDIEIYQNEHPCLESYWRSIILFGKNVASYKFALGKSLLELAEKQQTIITLEELAVPYSKHICEHIANAPRQATSNSSKFLEKCKEYNEGKIRVQELYDITVERGFNNVIDAFHVVNRDSIQVEFFTKNYKRGSKKIILTDEIFGLQENHNKENIYQEVESRWNLVEKAWELGISRNLLDVKYDDEKKIFFVNQDLKRKDVTTARSALSGYQKGKCFYCFGDISVEKGSEELCDVDHFYPHTLKKTMLGVNIDGVWNLVLACPHCNRGENGKFERIPERKYLQRLYKRNEFLISSHHPLRETIMNQTGGTSQKRREFLEKIDRTAIESLAHRWKTENRGEEVF